MSRFRKIDPRFWKDEKVRRFSQIEKLISLYLFTGQSNRIGLFSFSPGEAAEDLGVSAQTFAKGFGNVCQTLFLGWDSEARVLYLPTWWKYNQPENDNNVKGNLKDLDDVPDSPLIDRFINNLEYLPETLQVTFTKTLASPGWLRDLGRRSHSPTPRLRARPAGRSRQQLQARDNLDAGG